MPSRRGPSTRLEKTRSPLYLALTKAEVRALAAWAELRSVSNLVSYLLAGHLRGSRRLSQVEAPKGNRHSHTVQVWLAAKQRKELQRRAEAEMRAVANCATAVVVRALRGSR